MSWTRGPLAVLAVCVLSLAGSVGCGSDGAPESGASPSPVGRLLEDRDKEGRPYREVERAGAPDVGVEVQPDAGGGWDVRLTLRNFRFSPAGSAERAVAGRGLAHLYVDGRLVARLRTPEYRLPARLVPRGTHQVTARLYADDGTVWAVDGQPVETTADVTASRPDPDPDPDAADRRWARTAAGAARAVGSAGRAGAPAATGSARAPESAGWAGVPAATGPARAADAAGPARAVGSAGWAGVPAATGPAGAAGAAGAAGPTGAARPAGAARPVEGEKARGRVGAAGAVEVGRARGRAGAAGGESIRGRAGAGHAGVLGRPA
ncbi:hypothetical protein [Streptomyces sp. NPDC085932]|uniref:hypothetical protein n=1 Tax=Streptomyces sp. NPDC085932 TaxID=3365741 RepID=UPI0037CEE540